VFAPARADGIGLPRFLIVAGSGGHLLHAVKDKGNGKTRRVPLGVYLDKGADVHRREKPGFNGHLWDVYATCATRGLEGKCPGQWKVLLIDSCTVQASVIGLWMLKPSRWLCTCSDPTFPTFSNRWTATPSSRLRRTRALTFAVC